LLIKPKANLKDGYFYYYYYYYYGDNDDDDDGDYDNDKIYGGDSAVT
jgi:hypothetical protein